jgi:Tol biopolymer transport system component
LAANDRLVYNRETAAPDEGLVNLFAWDPDGTHQGTDEPFWHGSPAFSPRRLADRLRNRPRRLPGARGAVAVDANGSHRRRLTATPANMLYDQDPSWSPDGSSIVFLRIRATASPAARRSGGGTTSRPSSTPSPPTAPGCAGSRHGALTSARPTGRPLAAASSSPPTGTPGRRQSSAIYTMRPDGADRRALFDEGPNTANGGAEPDVRGSFDPHYSPSGERIVFVRYLGFGAGSELDTIRTDGTGLQTIGPAPFPAVLPSWGPIDPGG